MAGFSGQLLRQRRIAAGIPPERIALDVNRSAFTIHEYELGRIDPPASIVGALAAALGCSPAELFS